MLSAESSNEVRCDVCSEGFFVRRPAAVVFSLTVSDNGSVNMLAGEGNIPRASASGPGVFFKGVFS